MPKPCILLPLCSFSARPPPGPHSCKPQPRCYADMLVCTGNDMYTGLNFWQSAQHIVSYYTPNLPSLHITYASARPKECPGDNCLRILFLNRSKPAVRQMLNLEEVVEQCRSWQHTDAATGRHFVAECAGWSTRSMLDNIAGAYVFG